MNFKKRVYIGNIQNKEEIVNILKRQNGIKKVEIINDDVIIESSINLKEKEIQDILNLNKETCKVDEFYFDDIDCPNCANKVEVALNKSSLILEAQVSFLSKKIKIKHNEESIFEEVKKIVKSIEPDVNVFKSEKEIINKESSKNEHHHVHNHCSCQGDHEHHEHHEHHNCHEHHNHHEHKQNCEEHNHACCCGHHEHKTNKNAKDFVKKLAFIIGCILFGIAIVILVLGDKEILSIFNLEPLLKGNAYLIPLFITFISSYILLAYDLIYKSIYGLLHKDYFNESLLMVIASIGAIILSFIGDIELFEACAVVLLYKIGESLQEKATEKSKNAIKGLLDLEINDVTLKDGAVKNIDDVKVGEIIVVKVGEKIPLDGKIISSNTSLDMKNLTGESEPVYVQEGDEVLSGSINLTNVIEIEVLKENDQSTISKVKKIVDEANSKKSNSEQFITKFARWYTPLVLVIAVVVLVIQLILKINVQEALNNVFAILVISCPCSLVISVPLAYFASIGASSKRGILVKGGNYLETLTKVETIVFDKTGTITKGDFEIVDVVANGVSEEELLKTAAMVESYSNHPIAVSIKKGYKGNFELENASIEEIPGLGLVMENEDDIFFVGNEKLMIEKDINYIQNNQTGSIIYVSKNNNFLGSIVIRDQIKENSKTTINKLDSLGIDTLMLTGDKKVFGEYVANEVGIKNVCAELLPQDKYLIVDSLVENKKKNIVYVGDGINDTPSLRRSDVGIALGGIGSDLAKEAADIVIMNDDISKVGEVIDISKFTKRIILQNVIFILLTKIIAMTISIAGILSSYAMLIAIFADVGVCLLCVLNSLRILSFKDKK